MSIIRCDHCEKTYDSDFTDECYCNRTTTTVQFEISLKDARKVIDIVHDKGYLNKDLKQTSTNTYIIRDVTVEEHLECDNWDLFQEVKAEFDSQKIEYEIEHV